VTTNLLSETTVLAAVLGGWALIAVWAGWLVRLGLEGGDRPGDALSRISADGQWLVVTNPGPVAVIVGVRRHRRRRLAATWTPSLVVRAAHRHERGVSWSDAVVGAVAPGTEWRWPVPPVGTPSCLRVAIGQPGGRLRIHDHLSTIVPDRRRHHSGRAARPTLNTNQRSTE
jgi:hypothetical protein